MSSLPGRVGLHALVGKPSVRTTAGFPSFNVTVLWGVNLRTRRRNSLARGHLFPARIALGLAIVLGGLSAPLAAQQMREIPQELLREVLPAAERFDKRAGDPLVFRGWARGVGGEEELVGFAFHTVDVPPERRGYSGPIEALVGMDLNGVITGVRITDYWESISSSMGDFLRRPGVQEQFTGKHISEGFSPRDDVRAVSRATISTRGLSLGVRDAARRVANAYLATAIDTTDPLRPLEDLTWYELQQRGVVVPVQVTGGGNRAAEITLAYMESAVFADRLVGPDAVQMAERYWNEAGTDAHVFFYGLDGSDLTLFRPEGWSVIQDGDTLDISARDFHPFGLSNGGLLAQQVITGGVLVVDGALDATRAFRFQYDYPPSPPPYSVEYRTEEARARALAAVEYFRRDSAAMAAREGAGTEDEPSSAPDSLATTAAGDGPEEVSAAAAPPEADAAEVREQGSDGANAAASQGLSAAAAEPTEASAGEEGVQPAGPEDDQASAPGPVAPSDPSGARGPDASELSSDVFAQESEGSVWQEVLSTTRWTRVGALLVLLSLTLLAFLTKREPLRWMVLAMTLVYLGFMDGGFLSVSHVTAAVTVGAGVFLGDLSLLIMVAFTVVTTLIWGRVFCGYLCPFGALEDFIARVVPDRLQWSPGGVAHRGGLWLKYVILAGLVIAALVGVRAPLYGYVEPFGTVFFLSTSITMWAIALVLLAASAVVPRFYCRYVCPLGAALALGSVVAPARIRRVEHCVHCKVCEQDCPTGAITGAEIDFKECVRCSDCEVKLIRRAGVCQHPIDDVRKRLAHISRPGRARSGT